MILFVFLIITYTCIIHLSIRHDKHFIIYQTEVYTAAHLTSDPGVPTSNSGVPTSDPGVPKWLTRWK